MIPERYQRYEKVVTLACVNFQTAWGDKAANLARMKAHIETAVSLGSRIIVFPEMALSGYECTEDTERSGKPCSMHHEAAETIPGPSTEALAELTRKHSAYVILGMPERDRKRPELCYNAAAVIGPEGVIGSYRKLHLASGTMGTESICFTPGNDLPVFETRYGPIGILICYDFWRHPELSRILALKGARIVVNPTAGGVGAGRDEWSRTINAARASENFVYVGSANLAGVDRKTVFYGCSTIAGPMYPRLAPVMVQAGDREQIVTAALNFEALHHLDGLNHWKQERRADVINREFVKLAKQER